MADILREIGILITSRYPIIEIVSWEDARVERELESLAGSMLRKLRVWSCSRGLHQPGSTASEGAASPEEVLRRFIADGGRSVYLIKDLHPFLGSDPHIVRLLRDCAAAATGTDKSLILLMPSMTVPSELEKEITVIDYPLPDAAMLLAVLRQMMEELKSNGAITISGDPQLPEKLARAAVGLTLTEAENVFARAVVADRTLDEKDIDFITEEKRQVIRKSGTLEYQEPGADLSAVGGLENLKEWAEKRKRAFSAEARSFGLPEPRGLLLVGVQGCGKSLCARALSAYWQMPLLRLDMGAIYGKYVGESEQNARRVMSTAESIAPVILWIDEIEKGFAGLGGDGDGGTSSRVFGSFLTWMQEKRKPVFIFATANDITRLPPEFLRKGRFDEIFFVDLPSAREREEIFRIHLKKRGKNAEKFECRRLAEAAAGFSGAEIEQAIISGMYEAFDAGRELEPADVIGAIGGTTPLSATAREKMEWLRQWASDRAVRASGED